MKTYGLKTALLAMVAILCLSCKKKDPEKTNDTTNQTTNDGVLRGKLVYHNYTTYETNDSKMYLYEFESNELTCISETWNIQNPMNAHFSPDGKQITFMGKDNNTELWSIYLYTLGSSQHPSNLTSSGNMRAEDPKFSPDGKSIAFKYDWRVATIDIDSKEITFLTDYDYGMPYYSTDGKKLVCSKDDGPTSAIYTIDIATQTVKKLYDAPNVQDYYPITADNSSFFYSVGYSPSNTIDQVYRGFWDGRPSERLPFNDSDGDYSDAYPMNNEWVMICSTRPEGEGNYDLYMANLVSGKVVSMNERNPNINTAKNELGPCVFLYK